MKTLDSIALLIPVSFATILFLSFMQKPKIQNLSKNVAAVPSEKVLPTIQKLSEVMSGDGTMKLTLSKANNQDGTASYDLQSLDVSKNVPVSVFRDTLSSTSTITLPDNSWSNDNAKFFIEKHTPQGTSYYVFKADGSTFNDGQPYLDVGMYWEKYQKTLKISTLTGWADKDLIIVYTTREDGSQGPSFWFVISSRKFLQLADHPAL